MVGAIFAIIFAPTALHRLTWSPREVPAGDRRVDPQEHFSSKWTFLLALNVILLVVGMVMDIFSAIVVVVPLIAPDARSDTGSTRTTSG